MIEATAVQLVSAGVYAVSAVVFLVLTRRKPAELRRYCYPFIAVLIAGTIGAGLSGTETGMIPVLDGALDVGQLVSDYAAYPFLFGFAAFIAGASRRYIGAVVGVTVLMRAGYDVAELFDGTLGLVGLVAIVGGYLTLVGLYFGPISAAAARQPPARELFYTKTRNLVLFTFGVLIVWAILQLFGLLDPFTGTVTLEYLEFLLRVGFAGFVFANVAELVTTDDTDGGAGGADNDADGVDGDADGGPRSGVATAPGAD